METCPDCHAENPDDVAVCRECGVALETVAADPQSTLVDAGFDPEAEREAFERRHGIDIGDRTVDEYLRFLAQQDYSLTAWFGLIVVAELVGVGLFGIDLFVDHAVDVNLAFVFTAISIALAVGIVADTRAVGQFRPWAKIRWAYVLTAAIPLVGHISAFFYLLLRRFMHQEATEHRRRLLESGYDLP
ncbi:hypothetical protein ACFQMM_14835 [Saliphagus sp. GCM10025308]